MGQLSRQQAASECRAGAAAGRPASQPHPCASAIQVAAALQAAAIQPPPPTSQNRRPLLPQATFPAASWSRILHRRIGAGSQVAGAGQKQGVCRMALTAGTQPRTPPSASCCGSTPCHALRRLACIAAGIPDVALAPVGLRTGRGEQQTAPALTALAALAAPAAATRADSLARLGGRRRQALPLLHQALGQRDRHLGRGGAPDGGSAARLRCLHPCPPAACAAVPHAALTASLAQPIPAPPRAHLRVVRVAKIARQVLEAVRMVAPAARRPRSATVGSGICRRQQAGGLQGGRALDQAPTPT